MTDSTPSSEEVDVDLAPAPRASTGAWRIVSILCAVSALLLVVLWMFQSRQASDLAAAAVQPIETTTVTVVVDRMTPPSGAALVALGLDQSAQVALADDSGDIAVPQSIPSLLALIDEDRAIHGLAIALPNPAGGQVVMSPRSTGEALLALSPDILDGDIAGSVASIASLTEEPAFLELEVALLASSNLSVENPIVEGALAAILDRVPVRNPLPDQGCDSIVDQRAYTVAGTCVDPTDAGALISNEQDRWALMFAGPAPFEQVCAALMPANASQTRAAVDADTCGASALMTAPGPAPAERDDQPFVQSRIRDATAVQLYANFVAPWADMAGGAAGLAARAPSQLVADPAEVVSAVESMRTNDAGIAEALSVALAPSTPIERHTAAITLTSAALSDQYATQFDAQPLSELPVASELLDFFVRVGEAMSETERRESKWIAPSSGVVVMGADT